MRRMLVIALLLAGCVQLPPTPEDIQAKKFQIPSDKSAIYIVRTPLDSSEAATLWIDNSQVTTYGGTYYRWEVAPGTHRVNGTGAGMETATLTTEGGKIYFLEHTVIGDPDDGGVQNTDLRKIGEQDGRKLVMRSQSMM